MYNYINKNNDYDIYVYYSERIIENIGFVEIETNRVSWLGFDLVTLWGVGSLIRFGIYFKPQLFKKWEEKLNDNGLFENKEDCWGYYDDYMVQAMKDEVEDCWMEIEKIEPLRIGKLII